MNYSMLDEIWDNYKYPNKEMNDRLPSRSEQDHQLQNNHPSVNPLTPNKVHIEQFKPVRSSTSSPSPPPPTNNTTSMGTSPYVPEHPSNSNHSSTDTYNNIPYGKNDVYTPLLTHTNNSSNMNNVCMGSFHHLKNCRYCYEQMRKELRLESIRDEKSILDFLPKVDTNMVILVLGGIAAGMILSDLFFRRRHRR